MVNLRNYFTGKTFHYYEFRKVNGEIEENGDILELVEVADRKVLFRLEFNSRRKNEEVLFAVVVGEKSNKYLSENIYKDTGRSILLYSESNLPWSKGEIIRRLSEFYYI